MSENRGTIKIKPWVLIESNKNGSAYPRFYNEKQPCMDAYEAQDEPFSEYPDQRELIIDLATGRILNAEDSKKD